MAFGFYFPTKAAPTSQWVPSYGPNAPADPVKDRSQQIEVEMGDGSSRVQDKGTAKRKWDLQFSLVSKTDRDAYEAFWDTVKKGLEKFEFEDFAENLYTVRIQNEFNFRKSQSLLYEGNIALKEM